MKRWGRLFHCKSRAMKIKQIVCWSLISASSLLLISCASSKSVVETENEARRLEKAGKYTEATLAWQSEFETLRMKGDEIAPKDYAEGGKTAMKAGRPDLAEIWLELARYGKYTDAELELCLADIYHERNEVSKEIRMLELYKINNPNGEQVDAANNRLFELYFNLKDYSKALDAWSKSDGNFKQTETAMNNYLQILIHYGHQEEADEIARKLLRLNPENEEATSWGQRTML